VAAAIPVLLLSGWVATLMAQQERELTRSAAVASAARVAERVASDIATQIAVLRAEAASASLDRPDLTAFYAEAERLRREHPLWETVELAGPDGVQVVNLLRSLDDQLGPTADRASFDAVVRTGRPVVGGIGPLGPISGKRLVALRVPVVRDGTLRHVLSVGLATSAVSARSFATRARRRAGSGPSSMRRATPSHAPGPRRRNSATRPAPPCWRRSGGSRRASTPDRRWKGRMSRSSTAP
jgi:two-component system sensor histidine kinase UhpB